MLYLDKVDKLLAKEREDDNDNEWANCKGSGDLGSAPSKPSLN